MNDVERDLRELGERAGGAVTYHEVPARRIVRRARLRRTLAVAVPAVAVVLVAAVAYPAVSRLSRDGGGGGSSTDLAAVARATEAAETARVELEMKMEMGGRTGVARGAGVIDFGGRRSHLRMEESGPNGAESEMISIGDTVYQRAEGAPKWFKFEMEDAGAFGAGSGPADFLASLGTMAEDVTRVGHEELDGIDVTRYRVTVDPAAVPSEAMAAAEMELDPMDVWVDELGRLRKLTFASSVAGDWSMEMTMRLWDFGVPVNVEAPDPEDVKDDLSDLEGHDSGGGSVSAHASAGETTLGTRFVFGERGMSGPFVALNPDDDGPTLLCVQALPRRATGAALLHEPSGRRVATLARHTGSGHVSGVACAPPIGDGAVEALLENPSDYTLRIETKGGRGVVVPLETTENPFEG